MNHIVTVSIASYNNAPYIERCIESVLGQTYRNLDILIVDDGSKDDTLERLEKYKTEEKVRIITKENGGLSSVRQKSLEEATGDFICFIDADDYLMPSHVESMVKKIVADESDVCVCSTRFVNADGLDLAKESLPFKCKDSKTPYISSVLFLGDVKNALWYRLLLSDSWNKLYRLSSLRKTGVSFKMPKGLNGTDYLFNTLLAVHELKYSTIASAGYVHVIYPSSAVHRKNKRIQESYQIIIRELIKECESVGKYGQMKKRITVEYYSTLMSSYKDVLDDAQNYREVKKKFTECLNRHNDFIKREHIETSMISDMPTKELKGFVICHKYIHGVLPFYFAIVNIIHQVYARG